MTREEYEQKKHECWEYVSKTILTIYGSKEKRAFDYAFDRAYALASQWISVKERLPELRERVLICERVGNQYKIFIGKRVPSPCPDGWGWNQSTKESVVAWMPLPQYQSEIAKEVEG